MSKPLEALVKWERVVNTMMDLTRRFPKVLRPTLGRRLDEAMIEALISLSEARYRSRNSKDEVLRGVDRQIATVRVLLRLSRSRDAVSAGAYLMLSHQVDEVGRMIGGLRRASANTSLDPEPLLYTGAWSEEEWSEEDR